jgi:hypothetical protein
MVALNHSVVKACTQQVTEAWQLLPALLGFDLQDATCQPGPPSYSFSPECPTERRAALEDDCRK